MNKLLLAIVSRSSIEGRVSWRKEERRIWLLTYTVSSAAIDLLTKTLWILRMWTTVCVVEAEELNSAKEGCNNK